MEFLLISLLILKINLLISPEQSIQNKIDYILVLPEHSARLTGSHFYKMVNSGAADVAMTGLTKALLDGYWPHASTKWKVLGKELSESLIMDKDAQQIYDNNIRATKLEAKFRTWEDDIKGIDDMVYFTLHASCFRIEEKYLKIRQYPKPLMPLCEKEKICICSTDTPYWHCRNQR